MLSDNRRHEESLTGLVVLFFGLFASISSSADNNDASMWLEKMNRAIHEESYQGTFIYLRGSQIDTIKVVHQNHQGKVLERLTSQNGEEREIVRENDQLVCYHKAGDKVDLSHGIPMGPFTQGFSEKLTANQSLYKVSVFGKSRIADRSTVRIRITPRNRDRYGYNLWLDEESGLLLRSSLVNRGRVLELFQFSEVQIGENIARSEFASSLPADAIKHLLTQPKREIASEQGKPEWRVSWVPKGFRPVRTPDANRKAFTDGVATLSVFMERAKKSLGDLQTSVGGTVVITRQVKGSSQQITVVGEVPIATARKVVESIEPVIY